MPAADRAPRTDPGALRIVRWLAGTGALLAMVVVVSSATLRHLQAGLACPDRVACYRPPVAAVVAGEDGTTLPRLAHRVAASGVTAAVVGLLLVGWAARPMPRGVMAAAWALAALIAVLALIGVRAMHLALPAVTLANLVGGVLVVALFGRLLAKAGPGSAAGARSHAGWTSDRIDHPSRSPLAAMLAAVLLAQIFLGGWVSAQFAGLACDGTLVCPRALGGGWSPADWSLVAPVEPPSDRSHDRAAAMAGLNALHRLSGIVVIGLALACAGSLLRSPPGGGATRGRRRIGGAIGLLALVQGVLAVVIALAGLPLAGVVAHNAVASLLLLAAVVAASERPAS